MNGLGMIASRMQALQERAEKAEAEVREQAAELRRAREDAWDEGFTKAGRLLLGMEKDDWPPVPNPYRAGLTDDMSIEQLRALLSEVQS